MVRLMASALVAFQDQSDRNRFGWEPLPRAFLRFIDVAAARNSLQKPSRPWPTNHTQFIRLAETPLGMWAGTWLEGPGRDFAECRLVEDGVITSECVELALEARDPELEWRENEGYAALLEACGSLGEEHGDALYTEWRRFVIEHPVIASINDVLDAVPSVTRVARWKDLVDLFYGEVPEALAFGDHVKLCTVSGTLLRRADRDGGFHAESRDPRARRAAAEGLHRTLPFHPGRTLQLRRAFRMSWCHPGLAELDLAKGLERLGWRVSLWPHRDRIDVEAEASSGRRLAVSVKTHASPERLARVFDEAAEFGGWRATHDCFLVVPDHLCAAGSRYCERFERQRAALGLPAVRLLSVSGLLGQAGRAL